MRLNLSRITPVALAGTLAALAFSTPADAQTRAIVTTDLNMRAGPGTEYPVVNVLPSRTRATIHGCVRNFSWCDVSARGDRGWVSARYLALPDRRRPVLELGPVIGLPIISFQFGYWDQHYRDRRFYRDRDRWFGRPDARPPRAAPPRADRPRVERPRVERPNVERPRVERPRVERPRVERPRVERPRVERPNVERPRVERPRAERPQRGDWQGPPGLRGEGPPGLRAGPPGRGGERGPRRER